MSYTVLARKYRPQTFEDLVGQEHVARTLANAIKSDRVAHAFLFTGVRGVGKTTSARLLAKALNCENGPTPTPCNECDVCRDITAGVDMDVLEMDGASNNGVDDVRRLQESIPYRPTRDRFKVVIVDEVHMLSAGAFNAFLKTLEEPPAHVKFIFATTESHKVPITIRSRCQRYDFRLIPQSVIVDRIRHILSAENVEADDDAVHLVAREAAGSMRDALTLLDQVVAFADGQLRGQEVARQLGIAGRESVFGVLQALVEHDGKGALEAVDAVASQGTDMLHFTKQLLELARDWVVMKVSGESESSLLDMVSEELARSQDLIGGVEGLELQRTFSGLSQLVDEVGRSAHPRMTLEMGLVRLATRPPLRPVQQLLHRLERLERALAQGGPGGPGPRGPAPRGPGGQTQQRGSGRPGPDAGRGRPQGYQGQGGGPRGQASAVQSHPGAVQNHPGAVQNHPGAVQSHPGAVQNHPGAVQGYPSAAQAQPGSAQGYPSAAQGQPASDPRAVTRLDHGNAAPAPAEMPEWDDAPHPADMMAPEATPSRPPRTDNVVPFPGPRSDEHPGQGASPRFGSRETAPPDVSTDTERNTPQATTREEADAGPRVATITENELQRFEQLVGAAREKRPALAAILEHGIPEVITPERLVIAFHDGSFFGQQADTPSAKEGLLAAASQVLGQTPSLEIVLRKDLPRHGVTVAEVREQRRVDRRAETRRSALNHPLVKTALQLFPEANGNVRVWVNQKDR